MKDLKNSVNGEDGKGFYGDRVRGLRKSKAKTLTQLAKETGLSSGYLSQIERGLAQPSISALVTISKALGVNAQFFFAGEPEVNEVEKDYVVRSGQYLEIQYENGIVDQLLTPKSNRKMQVVRCILPSGGGVDKPYSHKGSEVILINAGTLDVWIGKKHFTLNQGDTLTFDSTEEHLYSNKGDVDVDVYWFITPASF
ncbi:XRE family transcriptional regulator [Amphritea sp. 1_MG-2023]|uniref:helix-turn-helix domain-containing protein n=1 Tax=Amphritea sp. 1_MG-2023 TaxID=3062670 RepID=UPI0026E36E76|nr:XRE family transcriptional regulator [Amphritea sp. 1_MG-2023]MDO6565082.1 XRE family transcriptional regulator [Amphritea sp. 1_MG-2023]